MPDPIRSTGRDPIRFRFEAEPIASDAPKKGQPRSAPLPKSVQSLVDQQSKGRAVRRPVSDAEAIAGELARQSGIEVRAKPPKAELRPLPAAARAPAPATPAAPDCFPQATKTAATCAGALYAAGAGAATGPADLVIIGVAGSVCAAEAINYYNCIGAIRQ